MIEKGIICYMCTPFNTGTDMEGEKTHPKLAVVLNSVFVILFNIVWEVVDGDVVILDVFHNLETSRSFRLDERQKE